MGKDLFTSVNGCGTRSNSYKLNGLNGSIWHAMLVGCAPVSKRTIATIRGERLGTTKVHSPRHTFARTLEDASVKGSEIQQILGHTDLGTAGRYLGRLCTQHIPHLDISVSASWALASSMSIFVCIDYMKAIVMSAWGFGEIGTKSRNNHLTIILADKRCYSDDSRV
jgi:hypothetical protein